MTAKREQAYDREDRDQIVELKIESRNQTKTLDEHTNILKAIQKTMQEIGDASDKRFQEIEARKMDRTEANRLQADSMTEHAAMKGDIQLLKDAHNELVATMRAFRWMFGIMFAGLASVVIPIATAYIQAKW